MLADDYFDARSRLGGALFSLGRLADLAGLKPSRSPLITSLVESLRDPFVFVVAGEVNAGKSTLMNALFGENFCPSGVLPETRRIHYFRFGKIPRRCEITPDLEEIELPHAFLRDFHLVDTPGVNSVESGHDLITGEFIPRADAVLFCFPSTNPWSSSAWDFLSRIQHDWLKKIVIVLQQSDLRTPEEITAITDHMGRIAADRLGAAIPVFAVSARLALLARTSGLDKTALMAGSGFAPLEQRLGTMVSGTAPRQGKLVSACSAGQAMLAEIQIAQQAATTGLNGLCELQEKAQRIITEENDRSKQQAETTAQSVRNAWDKTGLDLLAEKSGTLPDGSPAGTGGGNPEGRLLPPLMLAVQQAAREFDARWIEVLHDFHRTHGSAIHLTLEGHGVARPEAAWPDRLAAFNQRMETAACDAVSGSGLTGLFEARWRHRRRLRRGLASLLILGAAGVAAAAGVGALSPQIVMVSAALGLGILMTGWLSLRRQAAETIKQADSLLLAGGEQLQRSVRRLCLTHTVERLDDLAPVVGPLKKRIALRQESDAALKEQAGELALTLQRLARAFQTTGS